MVFTSSPFCTVVFDWLNSKYVIATQTLAVSAVVYFDNAVVRAL